MVFSRRICLGTVVVLGTVRGAAADPAPPATENAATATLCRDDPSRKASALTYLTCRLRDGLPKLGPATVIVSRPLDGGSDSGATLFAERLALFLASATGARNGGVARSVAAAVTGAPASADPPVLLLEPKVRGTLLEVDATLQGSRASVWARARGETNTVLAHAFASSPMDAELRSYLPPVPLVRPTARLFSSPVEQINAIACGDIDADGALEVALSNRHVVALGALTESGFVVQRQISLGEVSEVAPVPLRQPLASLWFNGSALEVSTTDRRDWVSLGLTLELLARQPNQWGVGPGWCASRSQLPPESRPFECAASPQLPDTTTPLLDRHVAVVAGAPQSLVTAWRDATSKAVMLSDGVRLWTLPSRGAQLAIGDLNHDGVLEVLSTSASLNRAEDHVTAHSLAPTSDAPVPVWEVPVPTGVEALALCPLDNPLRSAVLYASGNQLGVIR